MSGVAGFGVDERRAQVVLALLAEPDDEPPRLSCTLGVL